MTNPQKRDGSTWPSDHPPNQPTIESAPLIEAFRRHRRGYEIEDATLVEMTALLDTMTRKYRGQLARHIEDLRLLKSSMDVADLHRGYLELEAEVTGSHIGRLFVLHRQTSRELRVFRRWTKRLHPGWSRIFDGAAQRAARGNSTQA